MDPRKILIVEDEAVVGEDLSLRLRHMGYAVMGVVSDGEEAIQLSRRARPDLVLMDINLDGDMDGIETAADMRQSLGIPVIYVTAYVDEQTLARAKATLPLGYIHKPFTTASVQAAIEIGIYKYDVDETARQCHGVLDNALYEQSITHAIAVLLETKGAFHSKALRQLRMDLQNMLRRQRVGGSRIHGI